MLPKVEKPQQSTIHMNDALDHELATFIDEETPRGQASRRQERLIKQQEQKIKML